MIFITVIITAQPRFFMPRPPFQLTDQQAAHIARGVMELDATIPIDARSHRPYVRSFIALVFGATGRLFSPEIYRRLMDAYSPQRRPSMATLARERQQAEQLLHRRVVPATDPPEFTEPDASMLTTNAAIAALDRKMSAVLGTAEHMQNAQLDYFQHALEQAERELTLLRSLATTAAAESAAARTSAEQYRIECEALREKNDQLTQIIDKMVQSGDEMRKFSLMSIDDARGEVRTWKERCANLELQQARDAQTLDTMRRANLAAALAVAKEHT
ncbi:hypothetical protein KY495_20490 [Massilia sp. PAMC28688]|uniref:hypothetical protein n=1 Tax=Massilia sp. PAMC28688 TaxID=2861283 RepID=UPI001C639E49|nr:hypothetical protein [Massilia sp. PAMC28688]QYF93051.1 hypothetical protein KY495_20490 [Massilia sp. PAMC28688]